MIRDMLVVMPKVRSIIHGGTVIVQYLLILFHNLKKFIMELVHRHQTLV